MCEDGIRVEEDDNIVRLESLSHHRDLGPCAMSTVVWWRPDEPVVISMYEGFLYDHVSSRTCMVRGPSEAVNLTIQKVVHNSSGSSLHSPSFWFLRIQYCPLAQVQS